MELNKSLSADLMALVGDFKGAGRAIKSEMRDIEKQIKAAQKEINSTEKEKTKALKTGGSISGFDRSITSNQKMLLQLQGKLSGLESKRSGFDMQKDIQDDIYKKLDKSLINRMSLMQQEVTRNVMSVTGKIVSGRVSSADIGALGEKAAQAGIFLNSKGYKRLGKFMARSGSGIARAAMGAAPLAALGGGLALGAWKAGSGIIQDDLEASKSERVLFENLMSLEREYSFSSAISNKRLNAIKKAQSEIKKKARAAYRSGNMYDSIVGGVGDAIGWDWRGAERGYISGQQQKALSISMRERRYGKAISYDEALNDNQVLEDLRKETSKYGTWSKSIQWWQDTIGIGETTEQKLHRLAVDRQMKSLTDVETARTAAIKREQEDPMYKNEVFIHNQYFRALEAQEYLSVGNAHQM